MIPVLLKITNFFSHRNSEVDFSLFDSALIIGNTEGNYDLSNGSGKSSILDSILWCLFNKARVAAMDDIIFWGEDFCEVMMTFYQKDVLYRVTRNRSRITGLSGVSFEYLSEDNDWIDISGSTAKLTNEKIVSILKFDYKTFINSAYFRQNDISEFAESDPGKRKEILKSIIDLSKWDLYEKESKFRLKNLRSEVEILQAKIEDLEVDEVDLAKSTNQLAALNDELRELSRQRDTNNIILENLTNQYQDMKRNLNTEEWDKIVVENDELKIKIERKSKRINDLKDSINKIKQKILPLSAQISELEERMSKISVDPDIDEKIKVVRDNLVLYQTKLSTSENLLEILNKKDIDEETCHVCGQDITEDLYEKLKHEHQTERERYNKDIVFSSNKIAESNRLLEIYENIQKENKKFENFKNKIKNLTEHLNMGQEALKNKTEELQNEQEDLSRLQSKLESNNVVLNSLKNDDFQKLHSQILEKKSLLKKFNEEIANKNQAIGILSQKIKTLTSDIEKMKVDKDKLISMTKKLAAYEKLSKLLGKNGIQTILLNALIEDLEKTANQILISICNEPLEVFLETQRIGADGVSIVDTLDLKVKKDGITQNFKSLSGGEQFRISLSLRIALSEISSRHGGSSLEFLLLDEINSPLDRHGTENLFVNVIRALERKYKILVITHNDSLKEKFSNIIDVVKINGESTTSFVQK